MQRILGNKSHQACGFIWALTEFECTAPYYTDMYQCPLLAVITKTKQQLIKRLRQTSPHAYYFMWLVRQKAVNSILVLNNLDTIHDTYLWLTSGRHISPWLTTDNHGFLGVICMHCASRSDIIIRCPCVSANACLLHGIFVGNQYNINDENQQ